MGVRTGLELLPVLHLLKTQRVNFRASLHIQYSFQCAHRMSDTVLGSGNIMLTKTEMASAPMDLGIQLGRQGG